MAQLQDCLFPPPPRILTHRRFLVLIVGLLALTANSMADDVYPVERYNSSGERTAYGYGNNFRNVQTADNAADGDVIMISEDITVNSNNTIRINNTGYNVGKFTLQAANDESPVTIFSDNCSPLYNMGQSVEITLKNVTFSGFPSIFVPSNSGWSYVFNTENAIFEGNGNSNTYIGEVINGSASIDVTISGTTTFRNNATSYGVIQGNNITISGVTTISGNLSHTCSGINANDVTFYGDGSVGTFQNNNYGVSGSGGWPIDLRAGRVYFQDSGTYSFDGGITATYAFIDKAQVTFAGRSGVLNNYDIRNITISNGGKLTVKLDNNGLNSRYVTLSDTKSLVELTRESQNMTATIKSSTGDGVFQLNASHSFISSGRIDAKGAMQAAIDVGTDKTLSPEATFSPGNSVGSLEVTGNVAIKNSGLALFEFGTYTGSDTNHDVLTILGSNRFTAKDSTIELYFENNDAGKWAEEGNEYLLVSNSTFTVDQDYSSWLNNYQDYFELKGKNDGLYLIGIKEIPEPGSGVPEPSTWALLALGAAGLMFWRKRR